MNKNKIDWITILIYVILVIFGWFSIYSTMYNENTTTIYDFSQKYGMQLIWIGISFLLAFVIVLSEVRYYHLLAYPLYTLLLLLMIITLLFGKEVNGAQSWLNIAGMSMQPVEFLKIATALAVAKFMSSYNFNIKKRVSLLIMGAIIIIPIILILLQNDTGSALVFFAFFIVIYREGINRKIYIITVYLVFLFIISLLLNPLAVLLIILIVSIVYYAFLNAYIIPVVIKYIAILSLTIIATLLLKLILDIPITNYYLIIISFLTTIPLISHWVYKNKMSKVWNYVILILCAIIFVEMVDFIFDNVLRLHQQKRILDLLGLESDPKGWSYNVNQSKIAIGSGELWGKGFLEGTQTKFNFVPEQSTDFIFCTVGEEWGFIGSLVVVGLFFVMIIRLMIMGERQLEPFGRVYCYSVAAIIFIHFMINISMTIGLFPVVGIPLPFFSYGGSSLLAFTIMLFIAIRLDMRQHN